VTDQLARDAMLPEPLAFDVSANAREAGEVLSRDAVRAVLVTDAGRLVGVVTRKTLVREVVATGRNPDETRLGELDEAFGFLEQQDYERVPVVDGGKLVGVLSRSMVQRRLAEDDPPEDLES
jgi:CBS domain-containing protein